MTESAPRVVWTFRLKLLTALAVLVLLVMFLRARAARTGVESRRAAVRAALSQLLDLQQAEYASTGRYATTLDGLTGWSPPEGVQVEFSADDDQDWRAVATDSTLDLSPRTCGVYLGRPATSPHRAVINPGAIACW